MKKLLMITASCAAVSLMSAPSMAQSIDYTTMEELFGEPVTTSATGKPQRASEVPVTMEILTAEDIRRSGAVNLAEVLRGVNGVNVVQDSTLGYNVSVRGYNQPYSQRLLVLVNGRQVYLDHYGLTAWSTIPVQMEEIRQIEVVKGPNTALFGFNAVSGVVNIVTFNPLYDDESSAGVTVGTQDYRQAHYMQSLKVSDKLGVRISAGKRESNVFEGGTNEITALSNAALGSLTPDPEQESLNIDAMYQLTDNSQLRFEASGSNSRFGEYLVTGAVANSDYETKSAKLSYEVDSDWGLIKANIYKNFLDWSFFSSTSTAVSKNDNEVLVAQLEDTIELNSNHTIRLQGEYRSNSLEGALLAPGAEISYDVYAAGGMWNWAINDAWSWTNAARVDHLRLDHNGVFTAANPFAKADFDRNITEFSYNSGLVWKPSEADTVRISTSRGLEVPSLLEYGLDIIIGPITAIGKPDLDPAVVTNYELAWDRSLDSINEGFFRSAVFYQDSQDIKTLQSSLAAPLFLSDNIGDSKMYGIELALEGAFDEHWDWGIGYIYQDTDDDLLNAAAAPATLGAPKGYEDSNPEHEIKLNLGYQNGPWEADALAYYMSDTDQIASVGGAFTQAPVDSYIGVNARVAYTFDNDVTLSISGMNLQSSETETTPTPDIERRVFVSLSKKF